MTPDSNTIYPIFDKMMSRQDKETLLGQRGIMIWMTGLSGSGKSTVGMRLAEETGMDFVDVDKVIIEKTGKLLSEIIAEEGNDGFRAVENRINVGL